MKMRKKQDIVKLMTEAIAKEKQSAKVQKTKSNEVY